MAQVIETSCGKTFESEPVAIGHTDTHGCEIMTDDEPNTDDSRIENDPDVAWVGGFKYIVKLSDDDLRAVDLGHEKDDGKGNLYPQVVSTNHEGDTLEAISKALAVSPSYPDFDNRLTLAHVELMQESLSIAQNAQAIMSAGSAMQGTPAAGGSADGSDGGGSGAGDIVVDVGNHDYDEEDLISRVDQWLTNYCAVEKNMIEGAWNLSFKQFNDPRDGTDNSGVGVYIEVAPWFGPYWDNDDGEWNTDDGNMPDEWKDHTKAMREKIFQDDNVLGIPEDTGGEYDDWHNYVPAETALELGE